MRGNTRTKKDVGVAGAPEQGWGLKVLDNN